MNDFYNNLKRELSEMSSENMMITVSRKDLESLMKAYERLLKKRNRLRYKEIQKIISVSFFIFLSKTLQKG